MVVRTRQQGEGDAMKLKWLGHACFLMESEQGTRIVTDPFDPNEYSGDLLYQPVDCSADVVTISHSQHGDHNYAGGVRDRRLVKSKLKESTVDDVTIRGVATFHDRSGGAERGPNTIFVFEVDGLVVVHLGDLGHDLAQNQLREIGRKVDVLLCPIGGTFTIGVVEAEVIIKTLDPKIVVPMHFKTPDCKFGFDAIEPFIIDKTNVRYHPWSVTISQEDLPSETEIWVMDYRKEEDPQP